MEETRAMCHRGEIVSVPRLTVPMTRSLPLVIWFEDLSRKDVQTVGGKNASLGEMVARLSGAGIRVPFGFATSADMFRDFLAFNGLREPINEIFTHLAADEFSLAKAGQIIRAAILAGDWPEEARQAILAGYRELASRQSVSDPPVAVRSSATAEDLPDASFAGQQAAPVSFAARCG